MKHTPGPWTAQPAGCFVDDDGKPTTTPSEFTVTPIMCVLRVGAVSAARREADARLIAAAPDLLAALQWFVTKQAQANDDIGYMDTYEIAEKMLEKAQAAIKKATGAA